MMAVAFTILFSSLLVSYSASFPTRGERLIELSYTHDARVPNYPIMTRLTLQEKHKGPSGKVKWLFFNEFCSSEHTGTHMDAPKHFYEQGMTIDQIPYQKLYRVAGIKINLTEAAANDRDYLVQVSDLENWIAQYGEFPGEVVVLFEFGRGQFGHDEEKYLGRDPDGTYHFPGIGKEAAEWLVNYGNGTDGQGVLGVGMDSVSLDSPITTTRDAHVIILGSQRFGVENLMNLDKLPANNFTLTMFPIKIGGGSGGPTRVLAELGGITFAEEEN